MATVDMAIMMVPVSGDRPIKTSRADPVDSLPVRREERGATAIQEPKEAKKRSTAARMVTLKVYGLGMGWVGRELKS